MHKRALGLGVPAAGFLLLTAAISAQAPTEKGRLGLSLTEINKPYTGDLDGMVQRRLIRVLTSYSKTQYFIDKGTPRGTAYDQGKLLETDLNDRLKTGNLKISIQFIAMSPRFKCASS